MREKSTKELKYKDFYSTERPTQPYIFFFSKKYGYYKSFYLLVCISISCISSIRNSKAFLYLRLSLVCVPSWASITPMHGKAVVSYENISAALSVL